MNTPLPIEDDLQVGGTMEDPTDSRRLTVQQKIG